MIEFKRLVTTRYYHLRTTQRNLVYDMTKKLKDIAPSTFIRWHILLGRIAIVAAADSTLKSKQSAQFVCDGRLEDNEMINEALEHLGYRYGDWEWREIRRRKEWRWPWQLKTKVTRLGEGGTILLSEGVFSVSAPISLRGRSKRR